MILPVNSFNSNVSSQNMSFKGKWNVLSCAFDRSKRLDSDVLSKYLQLSNRQVNEELSQGINNPILKIAKRFNRHKNGFLYRLAKKYNSEMFDQRITNPDETRQILYNIYDSVKYPGKVHKKIVTSTDATFAQLQKIFKKTEKNPDLLKLADKVISVYESTVYKDIPYSVLTRFLDSHSADKILKNFDSYKPFIRNSMKHNNIEEFFKSLNTK